MKEGKAGVPKGWPSNVVYLMGNKWQSKPIIYSEAEAGCRIPVRDVPPVIGVCKSARITKITDPSHPSFPASGLFAVSTIPARTHILDYKGVILPESQCSTTSDYILHFDGDYSVDAELEGNEGRFVNDFRGIRPKPNVEFQLFRDTKGDVRMGIFSLVQIKKGTELCVTYGKGFWAGRGISFDQGFEY